MSESTVDRHRRACDAFAAAVVTTAESGSWGAPSPCSDWDARGVLEHVIGFHDVLVLRPLAAKPDRPRNDPVRRWDLTMAALFTALEGARATNRGAPDHAGPEIGKLLPMLTTDVLVHTWDLGKSCETVVRLDPELTAESLQQLTRHQDALRSSGLYEAPVELLGEASDQDRLVALLGRDPAWMPR